MIGSLIATHDTGWFCSNDVVMDTESDFDDISNKVINTQTLKIKGLFNVKGEIYKDKNVVLVFMNDEGQKFGFTGNVRHTDESRTSIVLQAKHDRIKEILHKIKTGG